LLSHGHLKMAQRLEQSVPFISTQTAAVLLTSAICTERPLEVPRSAHLGRKRLSHGFELAGLREAVSGVQLDGKLLEARGAEEDHASASAATKPYAMQVQRIAAAVVDRDHHRRDASVQRVALNKPPMGENDVPSGVDASPADAHPEMDTAAFAPPYASGQDGGQGPTPAGDDGLPVVANPVRDPSHATGQASTKALPLAACPAQPGCQAPPPLPTCLLAGEWLRLSVGALQMCEVSRRSIGLLAARRVRTHSSAPFHLRSL